MVVQGREVARRTSRTSLFLQVYAVTTTILLFVVVMLPVKQQEIMPAGRERDRRLQKASTLGDCGPGTVSTFGSQVDVDNVTLLQHLSPFGFDKYNSQFRTVSPTNQQRFLINEANGFHVLPAHFYSAIPTLSTVKKTTFETQTALKGIDMNSKGQRDFVEQCGPYFKEFQDMFSSSAPTRNEAPKYWTENHSYKGGDGCILWCMIRLYKPKRVIELGSGFTTLLMGQASLLNSQEGFPMELVAHDPYFKLGQDESAVPGLKKLESTSAQDLPAEELASKLGDGDILFIDTSHVAHFASDVTHLLLEVVPRLSKGVYVHVHDVFLPNHYPEVWIKEMLRFWNEQYFLQAFLIGNSDWQVHYACSWYSQKFPEHIPSLGCKSRGLGCFWMRRVSERLEYL